MIAGPARAAAAAGEPVRLQADQVVVDNEGRRLTATGNVRLAYKTMTLTADLVEIGMDDNSLFAQGHVVLVEEGQTIAASELHYDLDTEDGTLGAFQAEVTGEGIEGTVYLTGMGLEQTEECLTATDLSLTTCDYAYPHYHFTAGKVEYYPGDRLILRKVFYWEGRLRLLYLPYLAISLRERENGFRFPRFGYNEEEGLFLKLVYDFYLGERDAGSILLDLMQRKGIGEGLRYSWEWDPDSSASATVYHLDNWLTDGDDYQLRADLAVPLGGLRLKSNFLYADESVYGGTRSRTYQIGTELRPSQGIGPVTTVNYRQVDTATRDTSALDLGTSVSNWQIWPGARLSLSGRWYRGEDSLAGPSTREQYDLRLIQTWSRGSLTTFIQRQESPGYLISILPQVTLAVPRLALGSLLGNYRLALDYQNRQQETSYLTADGQRLALDLQRERTRLATLGTLSVDAWAWGKARWYDNNNEEVTAVAPELTLGWRMAPFFRTEAGLSWVFTEGTPPPLFAIDTFVPRANLSLRGYLQSGRWRGSITTGYALAADLWQPVAANLSWSAQNGDRLTLNTSYNIETALFGLTTLGVSWHPKQDWSLLVNLGYDPPAEQWTRCDFQMNLVQPFGKDWRLGLAARYDFFQEAWTQAAFDLSYVWHCRTVSVGYDWARGEISLTMSINAFPDNPMRLIYSESGIYFTPPIVLP